MSYLRDATHKDLPRLMELAKQMHAESPRFSQLRFNDIKAFKFIEMMIYSQSFFFQVIERDGVIIGGMAAMLTPQWFSDDLTACDIALFISPDCRGGMAAAKLIKAYKQWANNSGAVLRTLGVSTGVMAEKTGKFMSAMGCKQFGYLFEV
jgi:N-acetylglutamate synthase-like GNAT family acetyltransferase